MFRNTYKYNLCSLLLGLTLFGLTGCQEPVRSQEPAIAAEPSIISEATRNKTEDQDPAGWTASKFPDELYQRSTDCFRIESHTPYLGIESIDEAIHQWEAALHKEAVQEFTANCAAGASGNSLDLAYEVSRTQGHALSVLFMPSIYTDGAAHPSNSVVTMNFDTRSGAQFAYADVFNKTAELYEYLSAYARKALKPTLGELWADGMFAEGLDPQAENFQNFILTPEGLLLVFPPYQIAPYANGLQTCLVPLQNLVRFQPKPGIWQ